MNSQDRAARGRAAAVVRAFAGGRRRPAGRFAVWGWVCGGLLATLPVGAWALEFGKLQWRPATQQAPAQAHILLKDTTEIDPAAIRARLGVKESYGVAGLTYLPAFAQVQVKAHKRPEGGVVLNLEGLPTQAPSLDLLVTVNYKLKMTIAEFRVDLRRGAQDVSPLPAGSMMAGVSAAPESPIQARAEPAADALQARATAAPGAKPQLAAHALAPTAAAIAAPSVEEARAALQTWAEAWSRRDVETYLAAYSPEHVGRGASSAAAWRELRRSRIEARKKIEVKLSAMEVTPQGERLVATFTQSYRADSLRETVKKRVVLAQAGGRWLIAEESELR